MGDAALIFPGQGSQQAGMGRDLAETYPSVQRMYDQADEILGFALAKLCFEGPKGELDDTINTQPAIFVSSLAALRALEEEGHPPFSSPTAPAMVAGHSLGELTALVAAGAMSFADGLQLVRERGRLMKAAGERSPGGMAAVLKMDDVEVEEACGQAREEMGKAVQIANYNSPGQVVLSGDRDALARATELLRERGGRVIPLAVSIAAHSPLMASVAQEYRAAVEATPTVMPEVPVVANITGRPLPGVQEIRDELAGQLTNPVRWTASVQWMIQHGIVRFIEIGPKDILSKLVQRIDQGVEVLSVGDVPSIQAFIGT